VSRDLKFNEHDNFSISFVEDTQEWSVDKATDGGGFKENKHPATQFWCSNLGGNNRRVQHLILRGSGGRFTYALPCVDSVNYMMLGGEEPRKRGEVPIRLILT
jgi:hypothetical protein